MDDCPLVPDTLNDYEAFIIDKYLRPVRLLTMHFELTDRCNLSCIHCLFPKGDHDTGGQLTTTEVFDILLQLRGAGVFYLGLSGGEIFTRSDIDEILDFLCRNRFLLQIYTNGTLLDKHRVKLIAALDPLSVDISVYGSTPDVHDAITSVPGSFGKTLEGIQALCSVGAKVIFKGFLLKDNFHQRWEMVDMANSMGAPYSFDFNLMPQVDGDTGNLATRITMEQMRLLYQEVHTEGRILRNNVNIRADGSQLPLGGRVICNSALSTGCVSPRGEVFPCPVLRLPMGSLRQETLQEIWKTHEVDALRYMRVDDLKTCRECSALEHCNRCPGMAYLETGDYLGPAPLAVCSKFK